MDPDDIAEVLESTAPNRRDRGGIGDPRVPDAADVRLWRDSLLRFFGELRPDATVSEIQLALEEYG